MSPAAFKKNLSESSFLPFSRPSIDEATLQEVVDCLRSGWLATGPRVQKFEEKLRKYLEAPYALTVTSATAGLHLALLAAGVNPGEEVITTPMTFVSTLNVILHVGAIPVLVDIEPGTYNLDISKLEKAITPKTKAIIPVHFAGLPVDMDPILELAQKHQLRVIEDAAHAIGSSYKGRKIGSFGDLQVFSFHPCKNMTTAEGGCIITREPDIAQRLSSLRFHGIDRDAFNRYSKGGSHHYDVIEPGYKCNMSDVQAALGLHQIDSLDHFTEKRQILVDRYYEFLKDWPELTLPSEASYDYTHTWHIFTVLINSDKAQMTRDDFITKMKEHNIGTAVHFQAVHLYVYLKERFGFREGDFPVAENVGQRIVSLPLFPSMTWEDQNRVIEVMKKILKKS